MPKLTDLLPAPEIVLALEVEEVAAIILELLCSNPNPERSECLNNFVTRGDIAEFAGSHHERLKRILAEGWSWLVGEAMLAEEPHSPGWYFVTRRGRVLKDRSGITEYRKGQLLPKLVLDAALEARVKPAFTRGSYETAALEAYIEVEDRVRVAARLSAADYGEGLFRRAFGEGGPLSDATASPAERLGLAHLFVGSYAVLRNPRAHRRVPLTDPSEAAEIILLANHLLRIVTARTKP